ncbi:putative helicase/primase complex protein [Pacmanvirus S19]|nr:putative helicase/primase complex protein [Pacmanvirus S19]
MALAPLYEKFKFIHAPLYEHSISDVLENKYKSVERLCGRFVVYSHGVGYRVYNSMLSFLEHLDTMDISERVFHEVIFNQPQKLKFDIDAKISMLDDFIMADNTDNDIQTGQNIYIDDPELAALIDSITIESVLQENNSHETEYQRKYNDIFNTILQAIKDAFFIIYGRDLDNSQIIICKSEDPNSDVKKFSNHIIINEYQVSGFEQAKEFTKRVYSYLPESYKKFLDISVNKRIQNFRIVGCHKTDDLRVKTVVTTHDRLSTFITNVDNCELLRDIVTCETVQKIDCCNMHPDDVKSVLDICKQNGIMENHKYKFIRNGIFIFSRLRPSHCEFCYRNHDNDNTLIVTTQNVNGVISVFKQCRKYIEENGKTGEHSSVIGDFASNMAPVELREDMQAERKLSNWGDKNILNAIDLINSGQDLFPTRLLFDDLPTFSKHEYSEPKLRPFELSRTLIVHAMMKMGKTKELHAYIDKYFNSELRKPIIRFISFRQTFSGNIKEKFADFTLYSDVNGPLTQSKLIVQVESLYRLEIYDGIEPPDLVILDECESIFEQFDSGLLRNFHGSLEAFRYLIKYSKHIVCMDANISDRTYRILKQMRPGFAEGDCTYHCNRYKNATDDNYYITADKLKWLGVLYATIEADERIAIPMSSLTEAKILVRNLTQKYPEKLIKLYSSETSMAEKREHFADVNTHWSQFDILVYTPTVSAGVSFEQKHFRKIFGYFIDQSCPTETCIQMIGRIRDVSDHQFYLCVNATGNNQPTDIDAIKQFVYTKRENLLKDFDETGLRAEYGPNGEIKYHVSDYFYIWLENMRIKNISKNSFIKSLIHLITFTGAKVHHLSDDIFEERTGFKVKIDGELNADLESLKEAHKTARGEIREEVCRKIAESKELDEEELIEIHNAKVAQIDLTEEQKYAFERYRLRMDYHYNGPIDEKFVIKYRDPKIRRMFKNIERLYTCETIDESIKKIQAEERVNYIHNMELGEKLEHEDIKRKYVFDQHRYALGLLKLCGWNSITDEQYVHRTTILENLRSKNNLYWESIKPACVEFQIRAPKLQTVIANKDNNDKFIELMLKPINKILNIMYGIQIGSKKNDPDMFSLWRNNLFTTDVNRSKTKGIPLIKPPSKTIALDI